VLTVTGKTALHVFKLFFSLIAISSLVSLSLSSRILLFLVGGGSIAGGFSRITALGFGRRALRFGCIQKPKNPALARQTRTHGIAALVELGPTATGRHSDFSFVAMTTRMYA
jgi:hypothetical protein